MPLIHTIYQFLTFEPYLYTRLHQTFISPLPISKALCTSINIIFIYSILFEVLFLFDQKDSHPFYEYHTVFSNS